MSESSGNQNDTGQRSHKGPAYLSKLFRRKERKRYQQERDRLRAKAEQSDE